MTIHQSARLDYLAGFFDGEGTVGLYYASTTGQWCPSIRIAQNYSLLAKKIFTEWSVEFAGQVVTRNRDGKMLLELRIQREKALKEFIAVMIGRTKLKSRQLIVLDGWLHGKQYPYRTAQMLKALKRLEA